MSISGPKEEGKGLRTGAVEVEGADIVKGEEARQGRGQRCREGMAVGKGTPAFYVGHRSTKTQATLLATQGRTGF